MGHFGPPTLKKSEALCIVLICFTRQDSCPLQSTNCYCSFTDETHDADGNTQAVSAEAKSQAMAVAAGALSPLLVAGAGLGVWKLVSMKKDMLRSDSMMTNSSEPPDYISLRGMTQY